MVKINIEPESFIFKYIASPPKLPFLLIRTNVITDEILEMIDTENIDTKNIIFDIVSYKNNCNFNFNVSDDKWNRFSKNIESLEFRGCFTNKQFNAKHLSCMNNLKNLYIGACDYPLFENENIDDLPIINYIMLNGYGLVKKSENMEKWLFKLTMNGSKCESCI